MPEMASPKSEIRDGMRIDWDVPIRMDDGLVLRCDVFRPEKEGRYPVILSYGPYAKGLAFQEGYPSAWQRMVEDHPDVARVSTNWYDMQVKTVQYGLGEKGPGSRVTGELVCGDETLSDAELRNNRADFGEDILAHPLDDDYHKARSPVWDRITVPFLSAANW